MEKVRGELSQSEIVRRRGSETVREIARECRKLFSHERELMSLFVLGVRVPMYLLHAARDGDGVGVGVGDGDGILLRRRVCSVLRVLRCSR